LQISSHNYGLGFATGLKNIFWVQVLEPIISWGWVKFNPSSAIEGRNFGHIGGQSKKK
jgi:hypothetical protein